MSYLLADSDSIRVYTRSDWGARKPGQMFDQPGPVVEAFLHHTFRPTGGADTLAEQKAVMRGIQNGHMDGNGWPDIGYHFVVCQPFGSLEHARIFVGRNWRKVPAAQLNHNRRTLAVCTVGDFTTEELQRNTRYAIGLLLRSGKWSHDLAAVGGHRDVVSTDCPGDKLYEWVPRIAANASLRVFQP